MLFRSNQDSLGNLVVLGKEIPSKYPHISVDGEGNGPPNSHTVTTRVDPSLGMSKSPECIALTSYEHHMGQSSNFFTGEPSSQPIGASVDDSLKFYMT